MSSSIFQSILEAVKLVVDLLRDLSFPLAIVVGAAIVAFAVKGSVLGVSGNDLSKKFGAIFSYIIAGVFVVCGWAGLEDLQSVAWNRLVEQENRAASNEPIVKAPPIEQPGPVFAAMVDKKYSRTLTLPPEFFERVGAEGVGALSPYLVDPTAENIRSMVDSFRRSGQDVVFTRELTRTDESPMAFDSAGVDVTFERLDGRSYRVSFNAEYKFTNSTSTPIEGRFLFYPPDSGGTIEALVIQVDGQTLSEPDAVGRYVWAGLIEPGRQKTATVQYQSVGSSNWDYQIGALRRRVRDFRLTAKTDGPVEFQIGSINPSKHEEDTVEWKLNDVLTSQRLGLVFPEDVAERDAFLSGLGVLPQCMLLLLIAVIALAVRTGSEISPRRFALTTAVVVISLGSSLALLAPLGYSIALVAGSFLAAVATAAVTKWKSLYVLILVAFVPVTAMAEESADLWLWLLAALTVAMFVSPMYARKSVNLD